MDNGFADMQVRIERLEDQYADLESERDALKTKLIEVRAEQAAMCKSYEDEYEQLASQLRWLEAQHRRCPKPVRKSAGGYVWHWNGTEWQMSGAAS